MIFCRFCRISINFCNFVGPHDQQWTPMAASAIIMPIKHATTSSKPSFQNRLQSPLDIDTRQKVTSLNVARTPQKSSLSKLRKRNKHRISTAKLRSDQVWGEHGDKYTYRGIHTISSHIRQRTMCSNPAPMRARGCPPTLWFCFLFSVCLVELSVSFLVYGCVRVVSCWSIWVVGCVLGISMESRVVDRPWYHWSSTAGEPDTFST